MNPAADVGSLILLDTFTADLVTPGMGSGEPVFEPADVPALPALFTADVRARAHAAGEALDRAAAAHVPRDFDGHALLFTAQATASNAVDLATSWRRFILGGVVDHPVPYPHSDLATPEALGVIGPRVARYLTHRSFDLPARVTETPTTTGEKP